MYAPIRGGTRGGQGDFSWNDVKEDKDREYYLGHSVLAPKGRWQNNKDINWYNKETSGAEEERLEEIRKLKEAEEDALSAALGYAPVARPGGPSAPSGGAAGRGVTSRPPPGMTGTNNMPLSGPSRMGPALNPAEREAKERERLAKEREKEERKRGKEERKEARAAKRAEREDRRTGRGARDGSERERDHGRSEDRHGSSAAARRSRSPRPSDHRHHDRPRSRDRQHHHQDADRYYAGGDRDRSRDDRGGPPPPARDRERDSGRDSRRRSYSPRR